MPQQLAHIAIVVNNYDDAIEFYTKKLQFNLIEDTALSATKRWVLVQPSGGGCAILLAQAASPAQAAAVGNQTGGRVFLFLHTTNLLHDMQNLLAHNIKIVNGPRTEPYGKVLVFEDLYGNKWDLIEPATT
jgi:catechol 2,3-dioxygenase-like lactoylglutathione lyase family enzyme